MQGFNKARIYLVIKLRAARIRFCFAVVDSGQIASARTAYFVLSIRLAFVSILVTMTSVCLADLQNCSLDAL